MEKHEMLLDKTYETGNQVWHCPICNRRVMFAVEPTDMIVIENGDSSVSHHGSSGGLKIANVEVK